MRALLQRVAQASVATGDEPGQTIGPGWLVLLGVRTGDDLPLAGRLASKVVRLRSFPDNTGTGHYSVAEVGGAVLVVSQFTLYAVCAKGRRPGFHLAAEPDLAERCYDQFISILKSQIDEVRSGWFGADMKIDLVNWGPYTIMLDTDELGLL